MFPISVKSFLIYPNRWWKTSESHLTLSSLSSPMAKPLPIPSVSYPKSRLHQSSLFPPPRPQAKSPSSVFWSYYFWSFLVLLLLLHLLQTTTHMATLSLTFCTLTDQNISNTLWHPEGVTNLLLHAPLHLRPSYVLPLYPRHSSLSSSSPSNSCNL